MPVLECPGCDAIVAHSGRSLAFPCPTRCRGSGSPRLEVDRHLADVTELNGDGVDAHHTGAERRERSREIAARRGF